MLSLAIAARRPLHCLKPVLLEVGGDNCRHLLHFLHVVLHGVLDCFLLLVVWRLFGQVWRGLFLHPCSALGRGGALGDSLRLCIPWIWTEGGGIGRNRGALLVQQVIKIAAFFAFEVASSGARSLSCAMSSSNFFVPAEAVPSAVPVPSFAEVTPLRRGRGDRGEFALRCEGRNHNRAGRCRKSAEAVTSAKFGAAPESPLGAAPGSPPKLASLLEKSAEVQQNY